jgi:transcription elongation factor Elf1
MQFYRSNPTNEIVKTTPTGREDTRLFFCPKCLDRFTALLSDQASSRARARCDRCGLNWRFVDYEAGIEDEAAEDIYAEFVPFSEREARSSRNLDQ